MKQLNNVNLTQDWICKYKYIIYIIWRQKENGEYSKKYILYNGIDGYGSIKYIIIYFYSIHIFFIDKFIIFDNFRIRIHFILFLFYIATCESFALGKVFNSCFSCCFSVQIIVSVKLDSFRLLFIFLYKTNKMRIYVTLIEYTFDCKLETKI